MLILHELSSKQKIVLTLSSAAAAIVVVVILCLYLQPHQYPKELASIDSLSESRPDSALKLLKRLPERSLDGDADRMYYALLRIKVSNNLYEPQKDSTIFRVVDYFDDYGDKDKHRESCYYLGKYYVEHSDAPQALKCFQTALDLSDDKTPLSFKSKVYSQSGTLFLYQNLTEEALQMYRESYKCDSLLGDTSNMSNTLRDMAQVYSVCGKYDTCEKLLKKAYIMALKKHDVSIMNTISFVLASCYIDMGRFSDVYSQLPELLGNIDKVNVSPVYCIAAKLYDKIGRVDSCEYYCRKIMSVGDVYAREYASGKLAEYYSSVADYSKVICYLKKNESLSDSVRIVTSTEAMSRMHALYNYSLKERENLELRSRNVQKTYMLVLAFMTFLTVIAYITRLNERNKRRCLEFEQSNYFLKDLYNSLNEKFCAERSNNEKTVSELRSALDSALNSIDDMDKSKDASKSRIYEIINKRLNGKKGLSEVEWHNIDCLFDEVYPHFKEQIYGNHYVDEREYRMCMLIKLGLRNIDISLLMYRTKGSISSARSMLYKKFFNRKGSAQEFNDFIKSL